MGSTARAPGVDFLRETCYTLVINFYFDQQGVFKMDKLMDLGRMDNYYEQLVKKHMPQQKKNTLVLGLILSIIGCVASAILSPMIGMLVISMVGLGALAIWIASVLIKNSGVEYEYTFVSGEMRIERIKNGKRRKKIASFDIKSIDDIDKFLNKETGERRVDVSKHSLVLHAEEDWTKNNTYYVVIHDKVRHKPALLIFTPDKITLEKLRTHLSIELKKKFIKLMKEEEAEEKNKEEKD